MLVIVGWSYNRGVPKDGFHVLVGHNLTEFVVVYLVLLLKPSNRVAVICYGGNLGPISVLI